MSVKSHIIVAALPILVLAPLTIGLAAHNAELTKKLTISNRYGDVWRKSYSRVAAKLTSSDLISDLAQTKEDIEFARMIKYFD